MVDGYYDADDDDIDDAVDVDDSLRREVSVQSLAS